jgi:hypothetical protein
MNQRVPGFALLCWALILTVLFHGSLLINQSFSRTYDALIHIFFASHYQNSWFDPWEPRWYTGFTVFSYPPLAHQLIALLGAVMDLRAAFGVVQLLALLLLTVGIYRFSKLLVSPFAAGCAALLLPISSAIVETVHVYGQLPTTLSLGLLLNALPFAVRYVRVGRVNDLWRSLAWLAATTAAHHVTTLFGSVFFAGPVLLVAWLEARNSPVNRRGWQRFVPRTYRLGLVVALTVVALLVTVWPYWLWVRGDPIVQTPIPHASRDSFIANPNAGMMFFVIPWASALLFLPYALLKSWRRAWPVAVSLGLLFTLGTGGTTPLPRLLLRGAFDILTLERFTLWAAVLTLPFIGLAIESLLYGRAGARLTAQLGRRVRWALLGGGVMAMVICALLISGLTRLRKFQPEPIEVAPIVDFLRKDEHWRYRYLTLGFGDQIAWLSANTSALTPDGNYHSARRLIELTSAPIERLDGAKYSGVPGLGSLEEFLSLPEKFNLKYVFAADSFYDPLLYFSGWQRLGRLENGVVYWEREDIPPLPERLPRPVIDWPLRVMWGVLPVLALLAAAASLRLPNRAVVTVAAWQRRGLGRRLLCWLREEQPVELSPALTGSPASPALLSMAKLPLKTRVWRVAGLMLLALFAGTAVHLLWPRDSALDAVQRVVSAYWDDLDYRRFHNAYERVDPQNGLTFERFTLDQSVRGGLRDNYAKLQRVDTRVIGFEATRAVVRVELHWITALSEFTEKFTHELSLSPRGWRITQQPLSLPRSRDRFAQEAEVSYYRAPRRLTSAVSDANDLLDRPHLGVVGARLVSWQRPDQRPDQPPDQHSDRGAALSVIGELENLDARPADCTVTVRLLDKNGVPLATQNVGTSMLHKLLPGERTPFRVDFTGAGAVVDAAQVRSFEVFAKGVVTSLDLQRPLAAWLHTGSAQLKGRVYNVSTREVTVPRALLSLYDSSGLAWLEVQTLNEAIAPRFSAELILDPALPVAYRVISRQRGDSGDELAGVVNTAPRPPLTAGLKVGTLRAYRVQLHGFQRQP